jgi:hypothetical protein
VYRLRDLPVLYEKYGKFTRQFQVMNLIRHPVSLVWSGYGQFKELFRYDLNELHWTSGKVLNTARDFVHQLALKYDLYVGDLENLAFIGAAAILGSLRLDLDALKQVEHIPDIYYHGTIKMEEITGNPDILRKVIDLLSGTNMRSSEKYLTAVYNAGIVNEHKDDTNKRDAAARYEKFTDWQKEILDYYMKKYNIRQDYEKLGYSFLFMD